MTLADKASNGAKWTALSSGLGALIGVAQISIVARFLEPADFGTVAMILAVLSIADVFVTVGFSDVLVVKQEATARQLSTMYWLNVLFGIAAYALLFLGAPFLSLIIERDGVETMGRVMAISVLMGAWVVQFSALMRRKLYFKALAIISVVAQVFGFLTIVVLVTAGLGVWSLIIANLIAQLVTNVALLAFAARHGWWPRLVFDVFGMVEMLRFGAYRIGAALLNTIYTRADQLAIGAFLGPIALGYYTVAFNLAMQPFSRINPILTQISFPVFAKIRNDDARLLRGYRKGVRLLMAINAPLLIGLIAVAPLLIPTLLGPGWEQSVYVTQILSIFVLLRSAGNINIGLILAKEKFSWPMYWNLLLVLLIPSTIYIAAELSQSLIVVCWTVVGVQLFLFVMAYVLFARRLLGGFAVAYVSDFGRPVLTAAVMGAAVVWLQGVIAFQSQWLALVVLIPVGALLYVVLSVMIQRQHSVEALGFVKAKM